MKSLFRMFVAAVGLVLASGAAMADSQYGYDPAGTGVRSAQSTLNVVVAVPKLILLRVGASNSVSTATITASVTIPAGAVAPVNGNLTSVDWNGAAPVFGAASSAPVAVYAWTNNANHASFTVAAGAFGAGGPALSDVTVTNTVVSGTGVAHPGGNLAGGPAVQIDRGAVQSSNWTFNVAPAVLQTLTAGTYTSTVVYTATTL